MDSFIPTSRAGNLPDSFPSTCWSLVVKAASPASAEARDALNELCSVYWYPIYAFIRRKGNDPGQALDLTQDFFLRLLEQDLLASVDHHKGRFRSFLRTVCANFLIDTWRRKPAAELKPISIDARDAEGRYMIEPTDNVTAENLFDRAWAITLLDRVLALLGAEYAESGRSELFDHLKVTLTEGKGVVRAAVVAERLGKPENAVHIANHRLRERYREILQEQIAATLDDPSEMDDEIRSLFDAVRPASKNR
jgi:DNA-directed RNA polymerase specialized sigma24 family protein